LICEAVSLKALFYTPAGGIFVLAANLSSSRISSLPSDGIDEERRVGQVHTLVLDAHVMIASRRWREGAPETTTNGLQVSSLSSSPNHGNW
jgi:hypothetical protein